MNPYEAPKASGGGESPARRGKYYARLEGDKLVVQKDAELPSVCLKCGTHDGIVRRKAKFQWSPVWARVLIPFCWPAGLVAMLATTKRGQLDVPLCVPCNGRWSQAIAAIVIGVVILIGSIFAIRTFDEPGVGLMVFAFGFVVFLVLAVAVARPRMLYATEVDDANITLKGFHPAAAREIVGD